MVNFLQEETCITIFPQFMMDSKISDVISVVNVFLNLKTHIKNAHKKEQGFENNSQEHKCKMTRKANEKTHKCNFYSKAFHSEHVMKAHVKIKHEGCKDFKCETCGKLYDKGQKGNLYHHICSVHEGF